MTRRITKALLLLIPILAFGQQIGIQIDPNLPLGDDTGACVFRIRVDGSVDMMVKGGQLTLRTRNGREAVDVGSICQAPLPEVPLESFRMDVTKGRGRVLLVENPAGRNAFQAWVRIDDGDSGEDIYELRLGWQLDEPGSNGARSGLRLVPRGSPATWVPEGSMQGSVDLPGTKLSSYENDPLRYESGREGKLEFRGRVDGVVEFFVRGDQLYAAVESGQPVQVERFRFTQPLPGATAASISLEKEDGRGTVRITQQPTAANSQTAVIRVEDPQGGSDRYHWILSWAR